MILCTGSQGEPISALARIAYGDHENVQVEDGDTVIISAKPVPGNELRVHDAINRLTKAGALVLHEEIARVHGIGTRQRRGAPDDNRAPASAERHAGARGVPDARRACAARARVRGSRTTGIIVAENGSVVELAERRRAGGRQARRRARPSWTASGWATSGTWALRDRRHLSEDGVLIVVVTVGSGRTGARVAAPGAHRARLLRVGGRSSTRRVRRWSGTVGELLRGGSRRAQAPGRSTSTTPWDSSSTSGRGVGPMILPGRGGGLSPARRWPASAASCTSTTVTSANGNGRGWPAVLRGYDVADETASSAHPCARATRSPRRSRSAGSSTAGRAASPSRRRAGRRGGRAPGRRRARRDRARRARAAARALPRGAQLERRRRGPLLVRRAWTRGRCSRGTTSCAAPASAPVRAGSPAPTSSWRCSSARSGGSLASERMSARCRAGSALRAGLFDLRENLYEGAVDDLRALAA